MAIRNDTTFAAAPKTGDGEVLGVTATDKIAFYGGVPIARPVLASGATTAQIVAALTALGLVQPT